MAEQKTFKRTEIGAMSPTEYQRNRADIIEALKTGHVEDDVHVWTNQPVEEVDPQDRIKEIEARPDAEFVEGPKEKWFKTSEIARIKTAREYQESGAAEAVAEGRVVDDVKRPKLQGFAVNIADQRTPIEREVAAAIEAKEAAKAQELAAADATIAKYQPQT